MLSEKQRRHSVNQERGRLQQEKDYTKKTVQAKFNGLYERSAPTNKNRREPSSKSEYKNTAKTPSSAIHSQLDISEFQGSPKSVADSYCLDASQKRKYVCMSCENKN